METEAKLDKFGDILEHLSSAVEDIRFSNKRIVSRIESIENTTENLAQGRDNKTQSSCVNNPDFGPASTVPPLEGTGGTAEADPDADIQAEYSSVKGRTTKGKTTTGISTARIKTRYP